MANQKFNSKKLAAAILQKRTKENLSFRAITKDTKGKLPHSTLQRIEVGDREPTPSLLADICNWLEVPVQTFF